MRVPRQLFLSGLVLISALAPAAHTDRRLTETARIAAFARLYGVVRYFHPSDAAQEINWNRFAIYGVERIRSASTTREMRDELLALFAPVTTDLEVVTGNEDFSPFATASSAEPRVAWLHLGLGQDASGSPWMVSRRTQRHDSDVGRLDGVATLRQSVNAKNLRGKTVRLRAHARARVLDSEGGAALWMRVACPKNHADCLNGVSEQPIHGAVWHEYELVSKVAADAEALAFGVTAFGATAAGFDAFELSQQLDGSWKPIAIADAGFEAQSSPWVSTGSATNAAVEWRTNNAPEGERWLQLRAQPDVFDDALFDAPVIANRRAEVELGAGLKARLPLVLTDRSAGVTPAQRRGLERLTRRLAGLPHPGANRISGDARQADVVVAWNVYRHFYPYWNDVGVDWDAHLIPLLESVQQTANRAEHLRSLRELVTRVRDGHGIAVDTRDTRPFAFLPIAIMPIAGDWVISASDVPQLQTGDVIETIDGAPAREYITRAQQIVSGSPQRRIWLAAIDFLAARIGTRVALQLRRGEDSIRTELAYSAKAPMAERRPAPLCELRPDIWYVDLERTTMDSVRPKLPQLASARAVVFDLRGYPGDAGRGILPHLLPHSEQARWMHLPQITGPFGERAGYTSLGWDLEPKEPHIAGQVIFLTDGRAISQAESVLGYVADEKLGKIVGAVTAGTNGNLNWFTVPTGYRVGFTGMRVTRHDGAPFHLLGVLPTIKAEATVEGIRMGRDEVLQRALDSVE